MAEAEQEPVPEGPSRRASRLTTVLVSLAAVASLGSCFLLTAVAGAIHAPGAGQVYAWAAIAGVLAIAVVLPAGLGGWGLRTLRRRGIKIRVVRTVAGLTLLWNVAILVVGITAEKPWSALELAWTHARWVPLAALNRTPSDPSALADVTELVVEANGVESTRDLVPLLTQESAAGLAVKWLRIRDGQLSGERVAQLYTMFGVDREALVETPKALQRALVPRGRDLLHEVSEIVDLDADAHLRWRDASVELAPEGTAAFVLETLDGGHVKVRLDGGSSLDAVFEEGRWRLHLADFSDLVGEDRAVPSVPSEAVPEVPDEVEGTVEPESHVATRQAFLGAAMGRAGHQTVTTAFDASWPDSLTNEAAAATALEVLAWCAGPPSSEPGEVEPETSQAPDASVESTAQPVGDPIFARDLEALRTDYGLKAQDIALTDTLRDSLVPRGNGLFERVLEICGPVKRRRQAEQARNGFSVSDARRMRWAELDAKDLSERAVIEDAGVGTKKISVDSAEYTAKLEDGMWRIDWR